MDFKGKRVLVLGAARSGVAAAKVLNSAGADVVVNDAATEEKLAADLIELQNIKVPLVAGGHPSDLLQQGFDLIVKNPGIPPSLPFLQEAQRQGLPVISEVELAYQLSRAHLVAITGSNGKTTTTTWLGEMMKLDRPKVQVAGNIGIPLSLEAAHCDEDSWLVVELSSFQLNDIIEFHCEAAAILNISAAHLDWHGSFEAYLAAKANILRRQRPEDTAVLNADDEFTLNLVAQAPGQVYLFSRHTQVDQGAFIKGGDIWLRCGAKEFALLPCEELGIGYAHNLENAMAASLLAHAVGVAPEHIRTALTNFKGLSHRFQVVAKINGRTFINDSKATNPGASQIALTLPGEPIVLIAGGLERGLDLSDFALQIAKYCRAVVLLGQTAERLAKALQKNSFTNFTIVADMAAAVPLAYQLSQPGDTVLLSTGCASWDMYSDYNVRGDDFIAQVASLTER